MNEGGDTLSIKDLLLIIDPGARHQVDFYYDDRGNQTGFIDAKNNETSFTYDTMNNLTQVKDASGSLTDYSYDGNYNLPQDKPEFCSRNRVTFRV